LQAKHFHATNPIVSTTALIEIRNIRLQKVEALRGLGLNPYATRSARTHYAGEVIRKFADLQGKIVTVAGRLMSWRQHGALTFGHIQDQTGRIQLFFRRQLVHPTDPKEGTLGYEELNLVDIGDIVEATGEVGKTERGEISVIVHKFRILTKSVRPLPDQWKGLKDRELLLRKRYLHTILDRESFERFGKISEMIAAIREFLNSRGFMEFHTPVIQPQYGGGTAKPFKTHVNALGCDMYLAISHELYLKRLIVGGYEKVYTIGRYFRNEGIDRNHHPEFSMVETMTAYENYLYNMDLIEELFRYVAKSVFGRFEFTVRGHRVDFGQPWKRISMVEAVKHKTGIDFSEFESVDQANEALRRLGINELQPSIGEALVRAFELVEPDLIQPTIVYGHPVEISPLAKPMPEDPRFAERFEVFIAGMECGDNWTEQNDPVALLETWRKSYREEERDTGKFHTLDFDFIEALEYGMAPTTGIGPGIERMAMIFTEQENIDDVIFFPLMRPVVSQVNAMIYGLTEGPPAPVEDLALTVSEFCQLCADSKIKPASDSISIKPHIRIWYGSGESNKPAVSAHAEVFGFLSNSVLHLSGFNIDGENVGVEQKLKEVLGSRVAELQQNLHRFFPGLQIQVHPVTILKHRRSR